MSTQTEGKHTPGPWVADFSKYRDGVYVVQASGPSRRVLACFDGDGDGYDHTDIANARLIAAAPDLLSSLREAVEALESDQADYENYWEWDAVINGAITRARAAIAKAEPRVSGAGEEGE